MKKNMLLSFFAVTATALFAYEGPTFDATLWRGETAYVKVPDNLASEMTERDGATDGIVVELRSLDVTPYAARARSAQLQMRYDVVRKIDDSPSPASYCKVSVPSDAKHGVYDLGPLQLRVLDRILPPPAEWKYFLDLWQHPWAVSRYFGCEPFSADHYEKMGPLWRVLAACGQKALTVTLLDLPWNHQCYDAYYSMIGRVKKDDGTWVFDYSVFDEYVAFGRKCGIGPDIACYTMCPWGYVVRWKNEKGEIQRATAKPGSPEFDDYWGAFLVDFAKHLKEKGWFEDTYIAMDERSPDDVRFIANYIQEKAPGFKISLAGDRKASDFAGITIDNYSQLLRDVTDEYLAELKERREKGYKTTFYVCCAPPRPNTFMTSEDDEAFWIGAYPALSGFDGFLRWAANSWPHNPYDDAAFGNWAPGDTFLVYPHGQPSARLIALRAGIIAAEKARILNADGALDAGLKKLNEKYSYDKALKGSFNVRVARREIERLVNP